MTNREPCCIVGCKRTTKHTYSEWICGKHWKLVPRHYRLVWRRLGRRWRSTGTKGSWYAGNRVWRRIKTHVSEKALGL